MRVRGKTGGARQHRLRSRDQGRSPSTRRRVLQGKLVVLGPGNTRRLVRKNNGLGEASRSKLRRGGSPQHSGLGRLSGRLHVTFGIIRKSDGRVLQPGG